MVSLTGNSTLLKSVTGLRHPGVKFSLCLNKVHVTGTNRLNSVLSFTEVQWWTSVLKWSEALHFSAEVQGWASTLAGWLSWMEHCPVHQNVVGSIPGQGTYLGYGFNPWSGSIWEETDQLFHVLSLALSLSLSPLPLFLKSINISSGED